MTTDQAQSAVTLSAFVVASVFAYRKLTEQATAGQHQAPPLAHFVVGFGFAYITLSLIAQAAPTVGGMFAILVATGDVLANGIPLVTDLTKNRDRPAGSTARGSAGGVGSSVGAGVVAGATGGINQAAGGVVQGVQQVTH